MSCNKLVQQSPKPRQSSLTQVPGATDPDTSAPYLQSKLTELLDAVTANTALLAKQADLDLAVATAGDTAQEKTNAIAEAERGLQIAQVSLLEALKPSDGTDLVSSVAGTQRAVSEANKRVVDAGQEDDVKVPLGEVVFIRALPRESTRFASLKAIPQAASSSPSVVPI